MIKITIVEDNANYLKFLENFIELEDNLELSNCFISCEDVLENLEENLSNSDLLLLDLNLPGKEGLSLIPFIKRLSPSPKIIVLTNQDDYLKTLEAIKLGVSGYLLKEASVTELKQAIIEVSEGGCVIDSKLSKLVLEVLTQQKAELETPLSQREQQVLELLALGYVKKEIAKDLDLSYRAIALYTENIYKKLQVSNVAAAVATAIRKGLI